MEAAINETPNREMKCKDRIRSAWRETRRTLDALLNPESASKKIKEEYGIDDDDPYRAFNEYGLSFDYVAPGTFNHQREGYWRYQLSWGGPSDEFRFYASSPNGECYKIQYWFMDWFDGAHKNVTNDAIARRVWEEFRDCGTTEHVFHEAMDD
jgi:hypothetical protein